MNRRVFVATAMAVAFTAGGARADQLGRLGGALKKAQQFKDI